MKIAVLSDLHSNKYALKATLNYLENREIDKFIFLGDFFGYYPWAQETFELIKPILNKSIRILGNHDSLIIQKETPKILPEYWDVILQNRQNLSEEAIIWLKSLDSKSEIYIDNIKLKLFHGTPDNSLNGRFYPDNEIKYDWFPLENEILFLGHTHYPLIKKITDKSYIINPGSIGQPRDGNLESSLIIFDTSNLSFELIRQNYPILKAINELKEMHWYPRAINSLLKKKSG
jgi:putative phosphoesterase